MCYYVIIHFKIPVNAGHPMWPAIVLDESASGNIELLKISGEQSVLV